MKNSTTKSMLTKRLNLTAVILLFLACTLQAGEIHSTWIGGAQGDWGDASNWYPPIVPDNTVWDTFLVSIDAYDYKVAVGIWDEYKIDQLECRGDVTIYGPWYPMNLTLVKAGIINYDELYTARIDYTGDVKNVSGARLRMAEFFSVHGNLYNEPNAIIEVTDREMEIIDANVINRGLIHAYRNGGLYEANEFRNYGRIELMSGQMGGCKFNNSNTGVIEGWGSIQSDSLTMNEGIIYAFGGSLNMFSGGSTVNTGTLGNKPLATLTVGSRSLEEVNNIGTIEVNAGGGVVIYPDLVNEPNGVVKLLGGTLAAITITQKADATLKGFGGITGDIIIEPNAVMELIGPTNVVGNVTIGEGAILDISNGTVLVTGDLTCDDGIIQTTNGTITILGETKGICQRNFIDMVGITNHPNE